jgi:hypothetical protein
MHAVGVSAVVVTLNMFGKPSDSEETFQANLKHLLSLTGAFIPSFNSFRFLSLFLSLFLGLFIYLFIYLLFYLFIY